MKIGWQDGPLRMSTELVGSGGGCGSCAGDANADGVVGFLDLTTILANWGCTSN